MLKETFLLSEELEHLEKISVECDIQIDPKKNKSFSSCLKLKQKWMDVESSFYGDTF